MSMIPTSSRANVTNQKTVHCLKGRCLMWSVLVLRSREGRAPRMCRYGSEIWPLGVRCGKYQPLNTCAIPPRWVYPRAFVHSVLCKGKPIYRHMSCSKLTRPTFSEYTVALNISVAKVDKVGRGITKE